MEISENNGISESISEFELFQPGTKLNLDIIGSADILDNIRLDSSVNELTIS